MYSVSVRTFFRASLLEYWDGRCAVTGVKEQQLLMASHIKPWRDCATDVERLDVFNGLLLAAHLDKAFDAGLISFAGDGAILFSDRFAIEDRHVFGLNASMRLTRVAAGHIRQLSWHRARFGIGATS